MTERELSKEELKRLWRSLSPDGKRAVSSFIQELLAKEKK